MPTTWPALILLAAGIFTTVLGLTHFFYPHLFHYHSVLYTESNRERAVPPFRLGPIVYPLTIDVLYTIIWMMNFHVSFVLTSIGLVELCAAQWLLRDARYLLYWFAAWWVVRASFQLQLGRAPRDWFWLAVFGGLALAHVLIAAL